MYKNNTKFILVLAAFGFAIQLFTFLAGKQLTQHSANNFYVIGSLILFVSFILFAFYTSATVESIEDRSDENETNTRLDQEAMYRYIDTKTDELSSEISSIFRKNKK
jgi:phosphotransferase system  glucose/maltose/N-acetylglucosamine-specific IIC component